MNYTKLKNIEKRIAKLNATVNKLNEEVRELHVQRDNIIMADDE